MGCEFFNVGYNQSIWMYVWMGIKVLATIGLVFIGYKLITKNNSNKSINNSIDILKERYAKGEISDKEYKEKIEKLKI